MLPAQCVWALWPFYYQTTPVGLSIIAAAILRVNSSERTSSPQKFWGHWHMHLVLTGTYSLYRYKPVWEREESVIGNLNVLVRYTPVLTGKDSCLRYPRVGIR